ncbi:MAG TPA: class I SAM-dependent methyltransferase [Chthonomonadaceae bacterium]|nr:class I SAM-dependent methyltransferase [Chthonomonadaceae bacterium]
MTQANEITMAPTDERMVPESAGYSTFWEHIYRYRFAAQHVAGKRVLDIACGEGYGVAALARAGAKSVVGVDISEEACEHARRKYGIEARQGSADAIPLPQGSVDVIVSFETIEHVPSPQSFLEECLRVLAPGGALIISTPNKAVYTMGDRPNPYHCSEMTESEFKALLSLHFRSVELYTQHPKSAAWWSLRSIAASNAPWAGLRDSKYVLGAMRRLFTPQLRGSRTDQYRAMPIEAILAKDRPFTAWANPYTLWKRSPATKEQAEYFVAVARL